MSKEFISLVFTAPPRLQKCDIPENITTSFPLHYTQWVLSYKNCWRDGDLLEEVGHYTDTYFDTEEEMLEFADYLENKAVFIDGALVTHFKSE